MPARLEPVYLANVLFFVRDVNPIKAFPFVSRSCREAMLTLKTNPIWFSCSPHDILKFFPNINTMVVWCITHFKKTDQLPDTVTAIVVDKLFFEDFTDEQLRLADRVVEIRHSYSDNEHPADFALFPNLERLSLDVIPQRVTLPKQKLKRLKVFSKKTVNPLTVFPPECAEQIVIVHKNRDRFLQAKAQPWPPHVRVFCSAIGEGVCPEDFFARPSWCGNDITITDAFGIDDLRAFNQKLPLPYTNVKLGFETVCAVCDISFLTGVTKVEVARLRWSTLTLPTSVVDLELCYSTNHVSVLGTESVTRLCAPNNNTITIAPCPKLRDVE